jgi:hypothetical protein
MMSRATVETDSMYCLRAVERGIGQFFEQDVGLAIEHLVALPDGRLSDGLGEVAFARAAGSEKERIFAAINEGSGGEIEDQTAVHLGIEAEVETIERLVRIAEAGVFAAPFEQAVRAPGEFVRDQRGKQVDGRHGFGLSLKQAGFEHVGHAAEAELAQRALEFDEVHSGVFSLVFPSMRSR